MFEVKVNVRRLDNIEYQLDKAVGNIQKRLKQSASMTLRNAVLREIQARKAGHGVTGRMENPANWHVHTEDVHKGEYTVIVSNTAADYAIYLNQYQGSGTPYPFNINLNELRMWIARKMHRKATWAFTKQLAKKIETEGHTTTKWDRFIETAGEDALNRSVNNLARFIDQEVSQIKL